MLDLQNKVILASKIKISNYGEESFDTYFGKIKIFNDNTVLIVKTVDTQESIPYGKDFFDEVEEGFYELKDGRC